MLRTLVTILGVTGFALIMLVAATVRVNGGFYNFTDASAHSISNSVREFSSLARESYIYAQPLLSSYRSMYRDIAESSSPDSIGAFNTIKVLASVHAGSGQSPTVKAWLDLRAEPQLLHVPRGGGFVDVMEVKDLYGNTVLRHVPGDEDARYLFVAWGWEGEVPAEIHSVIRARTDLLSLVSATPATAAAGDESISSWAENLALVPMSAYTLQSPPERAPGLELPRWNKELLTTRHFIPCLNFMLSFLHPQAEEAQALARFERIGVVAGLDRAPTRFGGAISAGINEAREELRALAENSAELTNVKEIDGEVLAIIGQI